MDTSTVKKYIPFIVMPAFLVIVSGSPRPLAPGPGCLPFCIPGPRVRGKPVHLSCDPSGLYRISSGADQIRPEEPDRVGDRHLHLPDLWLHFCRDGTDGDGGQDMRRSQSWQPLPWLQPSFCTDIPGVVRHRRPRAPPRGRRGPIFGVSLGTVPVILLLVILAVYDAISVYKTKHMITLAEGVIDLKTPILFVIPKNAIIRLSGRGWGNWEMAGSAPRYHRDGRADHALGARRLRQCLYRRGNYFGFFNLQPRGHDWLRCRLCRPAPLRHVGTSRRPAFLP